MDLEEELSAQENRQEEKICADHAKSSNLYENYPWKLPLLENWSARSDKEVKGGKNVGGVQKITGPGYSH